MSLLEFIHSLPPTTADRLVRIAHTIQGQAAPQRLQELEEALLEVKRQLDDINEERNRLRVHKEDVETLLEEFDRTLKIDSGNTELLSARLIFQTVLARIDSEIADSRPGDLHKQKAELKQELANRRLLARLLAMMSEAGKRHGE